MATAAKLQGDETDSLYIRNCELIRRIRVKFEIGEDTSIVQIFWYSRINYYGAVNAREKAVTEHARFVATGELPDHIIRCNQSDIKYPKRTMRNSID